MFPRRWGGVRHCEPLYATLDLELFARSPPPGPEASDVTTFRTLIDVIKTAPTKTTAAQLEKRLAKVFKSNRRPTARYPIATSPISGTRLPWWTGADGVNEQALAEWFGHLA